MKLLSWNVAGLRATVKKNSLDFLKEEDFDVICLQETKCEEHEICLPDWIKEKFPHRYWNSTQGITQRKGLSGTSIWCNEQPLERIETPEFDVEGRIVALEFKKFILVTVYTPNSQGHKSERFNFRVQDWDVLFLDFMTMLEEVKPVVVCGDLNVANEEKDVYKPDEWRNKCPGFYDKERENFKNILNSGYIDTLRMFKNEEHQYKYWQQTIPVYRKRNNAWRIDCLIASNGLKKYIKSSKIRPEIMGSDHCPITCDIIFPLKKLKLKNLTSTEIQ